MDQNQDNSNVYSGDTTQTDAQQPYVQPQNYSQPSQQAPGYMPSPSYAQTNSYANGPAGTSNLEEPVSFGDWMLSFLLMLIPCVGIIMVFVWAFGKGKKSKSNFFKASLLWALIIIVIYGIIMLIAGLAFGASLGSLTEMLNSY